MDEYIKREEAYYAFYTDDTLSGYEKAYCREIIKNVPAADVSTARHGRWVKIYENGEPEIEQHQVGVFCSRCMKMPKDRFTESDFCPNCGANMG